MFFGLVKSQSLIEAFDMEKVSEENYDPEAELRLSISSFKFAYISSNLNNLSNPIQSAFMTSAGNKSVCPDADDIEAMYKSINCEINQVIFDNSLQYEVAKNVEKAIGLFTAKVEGNINRSPHTNQIISSPNDAQIQNVELANSLFYLHKYIDSIISENRDHLSQDSKCVLIIAKDQLDQLMESILSPLFSSVETQLRVLSILCIRKTFLSKTTNQKSHLYTYEKWILSSSV